MSEKVSREEIRAWIADLNRADLQRVRLVMATLGLIVALMLGWMWQDTRETLRALEQTTFVTNSLQVTAAENRRLIRLIETEQAHRERRYRNLMLELDTLRRNIDSRFRR